jgi:hypothetical protein
LITAPDIGASQKRSVSGAAGADDAADEDTSSALTGRKQITKNAPAASVPAR